MVSHGGVAIQVPMIVSLMSSCTRRPSYVYFPIHLLTDVAFYHLRFGKHGADAADVGGIVGGKRQAPHVVQRNVKRVGHHFDKSAGARCAGDYIAGVRVPLF